MVIANVGHQLPRLLPDFEYASGLADLGNIVLRFKQRSDERREIPGSSAVSKNS